MVEVMLKCVEQIPFAPHQQLLVMESSGNKEAGKYNIKVVINRELCHDKLRYENQ